MNKDERIRIMRGELMKDRKICDLTYGRMVIEGKYDLDNNRRYIKKTDVNISAWARELQLNRRTLTTRINYLKKIGLLTEESVSNVEYYVMPIDTEHYFDIEESTFRFLISTCQEHVIRVYAYLLGWHFYCKKNNRLFNFSYDSINRELGFPVNTNSRENLKKVLELLIRLKLIKTTDKPTIKVGRGSHYELLDAMTKLPPLKEAR